MLNSWIKFYFLVRGENIQISHFHRENSRYVLIFAYKNHFVIEQIVNSVVHSVLLNGLCTYLYVFLIDVNALKINPNLSSPPSQKKKKIQMVHEQSTGKWTFSIIHIQNKISPNEIDYALRSIFCAYNV